MRSVTLAGGEAGCRGTRGGRRYGATQGKAGRSGDELGPTAPQTLGAESPGPVERKGLCSRTPCPRKEAEPASPKKGPIAEPHAHAWLAGAVGTPG